MSHDLDETTVESLTALAIKKEADLVLDAVAKKKNALNAIHTAVKESLSSVENLIHSESLSIHHHVVSVEGTYSKLKLYPICNHNVKAVYTVIHSLVPGHLPIRTLWVVYRNIGQESSDESSLDSTTIFRPPELKVMVTKSGEGSFCVPRVDPDGQDGKCKFFRELGDALSYAYRSYNQMVGEYSNLPPEYLYYNALVGKKDMSPKNSM